MAGFESGAPFWMAIPVLIGIFVVQTCSWLLLMYLSQLAAGVFRGRTKPWNKALYTVYLTIVAAVLSWSMLLLLYGSKLYNAVARLLGATFQGEALFLGDRVYDFPLIEVADRTVVDGSSINAHSVQYGDISFGPCYISGTRFRT